MTVAVQMKHHMFDPARQALVVTLVAEASLVRKDSMLRAVCMVHQTVLVPAQVHLRTGFAPWNYSSASPSYLTAQTAQILLAFLNMYC